ncbi:MAG TPA: cation diffusion facilitator family transporter [Steroidobacteraceae bacterium]|nr:cation diffusion facilitator family transporter [Steroidobacteraceae bacterium]
MSKPSGKRVVNAAILANAAIAVAKFIVAAVSGSSALLSEGIHSTVDTFNECLLLLGIRRSKLGADEQHPFGHGKEIFFWGLMVAVLLFGIGGGMAIYEGITHLMHPRPAADIAWMYVVLAVAAAFEGYSFTVALRTLHAQQESGGPDVSWWRRVRRSKDPSVFTVFVEDLAALTGIFFALLGVTLGALLHDPFFDGAASLLIGATLTTAALVLAHESRKLLIGESAPADVVRSIREVVEGERAVCAAEPPLTMQLGPNQILVNVDLQLRPGLSGEEQVETLARIERGIRARHPQAMRVSLQPRRWIEETT